MFGSLSHTRISSTPRIAHLNERDFYSIENNTYIYIGTTYTYIMGTACTYIMHFNAAVVVVAGALICHIIVMKMQTHTQTSTCIISKIYVSKKVRAIEYE